MYQSAASYMRGPVVRRRAQVRRGGSTTDSRLLQPQPDTGWLHTDPWRVMRIQSEFIDGFGALAEMPPAVSVLDLPVQKQITSGITRHTKLLKNSVKQDMRLLQGAARERWKPRIKGQLTLKAFLLA